MLEPLLHDYLSAPVRQAASLEHVDHRPWPPPAGPWIQGQTWANLLFAHWRVDPAAIRRRLPPGLEVDTWEGEAWLGVTPFAVTGVRLRGTLPVPVASSFRELNVRTYVTDATGRAGVWFFSLDASSGVAVEAARRFYRLPYHRARIGLERRGTWTASSCARTGPVPRPFVWEARYRPSGPPSPPRSGTLEHFLVERYRLYTAADGRVFHADVHHAPWLLCPAEARIELNTVAPDGVELHDAAPLLHYAARQDVLLWPLARGAAAA